MAGDILAQGSSAHRVTVAVGGAVARVQLDEGSMVTVGASDRVTGVEVDGACEAIRSEAGALSPRVPVAAACERPLAGARCL